MGKDIDLLTITDSVCGPRSKAGCSQTDVAQIARLLYGAAPSSIRVAKNQDDLVRILQEYSSIGRLVFMLEGSEGQIAVNHYSRALSVYAEALQKVAPRIGEIVFDNCNVIKGGSEVVAFMKAVHASRATGASSFHLWAGVSVVTKPRGTADDIENALKQKLPAWDLLRDYLIPGQPTFQQMASSPRTPATLF